MIKGQRGLDLRQHVVLQLLRIRFCLPKYTTGSDQSVDTTMSDKFRSDFLSVVISHHSIFYFLLVV